MLYHRIPVILALLALVALPACRETGGPAGPADKDDTRFDFTANSVGLVTFTFDGFVTDVDAQPPSPFQTAQRCDPWTLSYAFDPTNAIDVDGSPTAGQYRDVVVDMTLSIAGASVTGSPGRAVPSGPYGSVIAPNLSIDDYADYAAEVGLPDAGAWADISLRDDAGTPLTSDALPVVLPTPLEDEFPTSRLFHLRQPFSTSLFLSGTVGGAPECGVIDIEIDIKPGGDPNSINCNNLQGVIVVAVLTTQDFDATLVNQTTVTFEGASESHIDPQSGNARRHEEDVDEDGDIDLVFHFRLGDTDLTCDSTDGTLAGETSDGRAVAGTDAVQTSDGGDGQ